MNEAQGAGGGREAAEVPGTTSPPGRFRAGGCGAQTKLMLIGASNLWFPATLLIIVMPESAQEKADDLADRLRAASGTTSRSAQVRLGLIRRFLDRRRST